MSYADVNGLSLYYEEHGSGDVPLILLHGGFGAAELYGPIIPALAAQRRVIAVDLQGHGRTADIDRPLRPEDMADDIAALIAHLGAEEADVMGYSLGGLVGLRTAIQHPDRVRRLVLVSIPFRRDGSYPEVVATMDQMGPEVADALRPSPLGELYARSAPRPEDWPVLVAKTTDLLKVDYDWTAETEAMTTPTMLVYADADSVRPAHIVEFYGLLGGGERDATWDGSQRPVARLAILPGTTHYDISLSPALAPTVLPFLEADSVQPPASHGA
jgi:pimeloyl-ACP methyl ester carboxylesterase